MSNQSEKGPSFIKFRTVEYTVDDLSQYFHLPLTEAAKELGICCTALKKICRKNNISQWPYRRLSSLDRSIKQLEERCKKKRTNEKTEDYLRYLQTKRTTFIQSPAMKGTFNEWKRQRSPSSGSTITGIYDRKASHDSNNPDNGDVPEHIEELSHPSYHSNHSLPSITLHNTIDNSEFYSTQQQHRMNGSVFENTSSSSSCHSDGEKDVHHSSAPLKHLPIVVENETYSSNLTSPSLLPSFHSLFSIPTTTSELNNSSSLNNNRLTQKISQNEVNLLSHFHQSTKNHKFDATTLDPKNGTLLNNFLHAAQLNNLPHQHLILMPNSPNFVPVESLPNQQSISGDINRTNHDKVLLREKEINGKSDDWPSKSANATSPSSPPSSSAPSLYHNSQASALVIHLDDKRNSNRSQSHNSSHHSNINNEKQVVDGLQMLLNISSLVNFDDNEKPSSSSSSLPPPSFVSPLPALPSIHNINNYSVPTHLIFTSSGEPTSPSKLISNIPILSPSTSPSPSPQSLNVISSNNANSNSTHNTAPVLNLQFQSWDPSMMNMKSKKAATPSLV